MARARNSRCNDLVQWFLSGDNFAPPGDIWQRLDTYLVVTA